MQNTVYNREMSWAESMIYESEFKLVLFLKTPQQEVNLFTCM
jgi:hypothetical protein